MDIERKHIITLTGKPGSGKSSTADRVAEMLGYTRYSLGEHVRELTHKQNLTLEEFNHRAEKKPDIDFRIDEKLREMRDKKDMVIDARLGFYWIPESFKVYLDLDVDLAVARIFKDVGTNAGREAAREGSPDVTTVMDNVTERMRSERARFKKHYGVDPYSIAHFDLVVDTARHSPQTVALTIFDNYKKWLKSTTWTPVHSEVPMGFSFKH